MRRQSGQWPERQGSLIATIAAINTNFTATTGNLEKGVKRAERALKGFGRSANLGELVATGAAALSIQRFGAMISQQLDDLGRIVDSSIGLGLSPGKLQSLEFAGRLAGVSADELATAMARMAKSAHAVKGLSPDQQFMRIADTLAQIKDPTERVRLAMEIFGRSGWRMLAMLGEGSRGIQAATADFHNLTGALSDVDFALADLAGDSLVRLSTAFDGLKNQLVVAVAPSIVFVIESLVELVRSMQIAGEGTLNLAEIHRKSVGFIGDVFNKTEEGVFRVAAALDKHVLAPMMRDMGFEGAAEFFDKVAKQNRDIAEDLAGPTKASDIVEEKFARMVNRIEESARRAAEFRAIVPALAPGGEAAIRGRGGAIAGGRSPSPASVEQGTRAAIEAMNKAFQSSGEKDIEKKQLRQQEKVNENLAEIKRAIERQPQTQPANIAP